MDTARHILAWCFYYYVRFPVVMTVYHVALNAIIERWRKHQGAEHDLAIESDY